MSDVEHARYVKLLADFYLGRLTHDHHDELNRLHVLNIARVGRIVTGIKEEAT